MKEKEFISIIKSTLNSEYIGDDCAYLKDLGIVISQDSLVEDIHFKRKYTTPFQLGYKSVMVNLSDIASSGAEPSYLTVSLSLPKNINNDFIKEFYEGAKNACGDNVKIVGGDITGSDKIFISVCAIGKTAGRNISSRRNAKEGYKIVVSGEHGSSAAGLKLLKNQYSELSNNEILRFAANGCTDAYRVTGFAIAQQFPLYQNDNYIGNFIKAHLMPKAQIELGQKIGENVKEAYAMMDTSDGLMDALYTISKESGVCLEVDFNKIPYDKELKKFSNWQDLVLFGGEDYQLLACIPLEYQFGTEIGRVKEGRGIDLKIDNKTTHFTAKEVETRLFNHFE